MEEVKEAIEADTLSKKKEVYTARKGFFYRHGYTSEQYAKKIEKLVKHSEIIEHGEIWKPFRGGASVANSSHWWVKFKIS